MDGEEQGGKGQKRVAQNHVWLHDDQTFRNGGVGCGLALSPELRAKLQDKNNRGQHP